MNPPSAPATDSEATAIPVVHEPSAQTLRTIEVAGYGLLVVWAVTLIVWAFVQPAPYAQGWRLVAELAFLGRLVNISDGIANGFSHTYLFIQSAPQDVILLLVVYPWVVRAYKGAQKRGVLGKAVARVHRAAEQHKTVVQPFGWLGLWVFVFFPFWSTGVLVGGVVGYLIGLRTWVTFTAVFVAHIVSLVLLIWFFDRTESWMSQFSEGAVRFLPWIVLLIVLAITALPRLITGRRKREKEPKP